MIFRFGEVELDAKRRELRCAGVVRPLQPQAYAVLEYLVRNRDRVVTKQHGIALEVHGSGAEALDLPSESVDAVVTSLVLCTVADPDAAIREVRRVLRPGGKLLCIEHVAAPEATLVGKIQRLVFRPWRWFFEGCHTHRDTESALRGADFARVEVERFTWDSAFVPVRPQIVATCVR